MEIVIESNKVKKFAKLINDFSNQDVETLQHVDFPAGGFIEKTPTGNVVIVLDDDKVIEWAEGMEAAAATLHK